MQIPRNIENTFADTVRLRAAGFVVRAQPVVRVPNWNVASIVRDSRLYAEK